MGKAMYRICLLGLMYVLIMAVAGILSSKGLVAVLASVFYLIGCFSASSIKE